MSSETPSTLVVDTTKSQYAVQRPIPTTAVTLTDGFWQPRREINRTVTLPSQFRHLEETDRLNNFRRAAGRKELEFVGIYFNDSDVYKWLEAASSALPEDRDGTLSRWSRPPIGVIAAAQESDGYLNTYFTYDKAQDRWGNLKDMHELYCAGHLFQAAVAHYRATGSDKLLNVARRFADCIDSVLGPAEEGKRPGACGHPEAEMALVELSRATGEPRYRDLAQHMVDTRGQKPSTIGSGSAYHQDNIPFRDLSEVIGHAVRMVYLAAGATDLYLESGEAALKDALDRQWKNRTERRTYVSGGLGSRHEGEAFGADFELPNARAYTETCAAIGAVMWDWRMLLATGDARYADTIEHTLINAVLPDCRSTGRRTSTRTRSKRTRPIDGNRGSAAPAARPMSRAFWHSFPATSTPSRTMPSAFTSTPPGPHRFRSQTAPPSPSDSRPTIPGTARSRSPRRQLGNYALRLRVPAWCEEGATLSVNGTPADTPLTPGSYVEVRRDWAAGDTVRLLLPMPVRYVEAHPHVTEDQGHIAVLRGPVLYCAEQADNPGIDPRDVLLSTDPSAFTPADAANLPGIVALTGTAHVQPVRDSWTGSLYRTVGKTCGTACRDLPAHPDTVLCVGEPGSGKDAGLAAAKIDCLRPPTFHLAFWIWQI
jgi:DUF1680 family protein